VGIMASQTLLQFGRSSFFCSRASQAGRKNFIGKYQVARLSTKKKGKKFQKGQDGRHDKNVRSQPGSQLKAQKNVAPLLSLSKHYSASSLDSISKADVGKYVKLPSLKLLPEGLCGNTADEFDLTNENSVQIREQTVNLLSKLRAFAKGDGKTTLDPFMLVEGVRGCGKSTLLNTAALYARENGWIVMFAKNPRDWISEKHALEFGTNTALAVFPSEVSKGKFGQPNLAVQLLKEIQSAHGDVLQKLPQKREYLHQLYQRKEGEKLHKSLGTIIERGIRFPVHASNCLYDLRMELSLVTEYPVLIVADQFNSIYWPTPFWSQGKQVSTEQLLTVGTFRCLDSQGQLQDEYRLANGMILCATTKKYGSPFLGKAAKEFEPFYEPGALYGPFDNNQDLKVDSRKSMKSSGGVSLFLKNLDRSEYESTLSYYHEVSSSVKPLFDSHEKSLQFSMSEGNPEKIRSMMTSMTSL